MCTIICLSCKTLDSPAALLRLCNKWRQSSKKTLKLQTTQTFRNGKKKLCLGSKNGRSFLEISILKKFISTGKKSVLKRTQKLFFQSCSHLPASSLTDIVTLRAMGQFFKRAAIYLLKVCRFWNIALSSCCLQSS